MIETLAAYVLYLNCPGVQGAVSKNSIINRIQTQQNNGDALANIIENRLDTIRNIKNNSENIKNRIGKQHNKISNFFGTPYNYRNQHLFGKCFTAPFNSMRTQPTTAFFVTGNQMFGRSSQLPTTAGRAVIKSNRRAQFRKQSRKLGGAAEHLIDGNETLLNKVCYCNTPFLSSKQHT